MGLPCDSILFILFHVLIIFILIIFEHCKRDPEE